MGELLNQIQLGKRYVYFSSQSKSKQYKQSYADTIDVLSELKSGITKSSNKLDSEKSKTKMDLALDFLKNSALHERKKEIRFFQNFSNRFPDMQQLFNMQFTEEEMQKDYINFIANINKTLKGVNTFKKEIENEIKRIKRYDKSTQFGSKGKAKEGMEQQFYEALTGHGAYEDASKTIFQKDSAKSFESLINDKTTEAEITNHILKNFGSKIFSMRGGSLQLNSINFASLIKLLNDKAYQMIQNRFDKVQKKNIASNFKNKDFLQEYTDFIDGLLEAPNLENTLSSVAEQFGINVDRMKKVEVKDSQIKQITQKLAMATEKLRNTEDFNTWFSKNKGMLDMESIVQAIGSISVQAYYTGEDIGLAELAAKGIGGALGGRANATDDIDAGKLIITVSANTNIEAAQSEYESKILDIQKKYYDQFKRTTDLASFQHNTEQIQLMREEQLKVLKDLQSKLPKGEEGLNYLLEHINIHDTIKGYASGGSSIFNKKGGFEGAAFGSNLEEQLKILSSVDAAGGLTEADINFFRFAMVNAGKRMVGETLKKDLENYFSVFVGFFMFNDAALMVQEAKEQMEETLEPQVTELHVYQLNGVYVPSSYLLQQTYEQLTKAVTEMQDEALSGKGTRAILHTYDAGPKKGQSPEQMFNEAEKSTKLEMRFLGGFLDLLNSISDSMGG